MRVHIWIVTALLPACAGLSDALVFDGFRERMRKDCRDEKSCQLLAQEAERRASSCQSGTVGVGVIPCDVAHRDLDEVRAQVGKYKAARETFEAAQAEEKRLAALHAKDEGIWSAANVDDCKEPKALNHCDGVAGYLKRQDGQEGASHVEEARAILRASEPKMAEVLDAFDWGQSRADACKAPDRSSDCDGIALYLQKHPGGRFVAEGSDLVRKSEKKRKELAKLEAVEAQKAQEAQEDEDAQYEGADPELVAKVRRRHQSRGQGAGRGVRVGGGRSGGGRGGGGRR